MHAVSARPLPSATDDHPALSDAFTAMRAASRTSAVVSRAMRMDRLSRLARMLADNDDRFAAAISADFGHRVADETRMLEVLPLMNALRHTRRHLRRWMRPKRRPISWIFQPASGRIVPQPLGIVGIVSPWNYPLYLSIGPLVDVLAAGNRAMIKPSDLSPAFSALLRELIAATFAPDEVTVVTGGVEVAQAFTALPFDHLFFTGSTGVGRLVAEAAAKNLTPVTLELGGKSPAIIASRADLGAAATSIAFGKFVNAGQTCVAPDHVFVPRDALDDFVAALETRIRDSYPDLGPGYTAIATPHHFDRLRALLRELPEGQRIVTIGADDPAARKIAPRLVIDPPAAARMMREEIFGPILPVIPYDDLSTVIGDLARGERPLALYAFGQNRAETGRIVRETVVGGMTVGGTILHLAQDELPFGGVGASGSGAYHGHEGFRRFSHMKPVFRIGFLNGFERMGPPWGGLASLTYRLLRR